MRFRAASPLCVHLASVDAPAWISAFSSVVSLVVAVAAAWAAVRVYRIERSRDTTAEVQRLAQAQEQRRAQGARVSAWWGRQSKGPGNRWGVFVRNAAEVPIYQAYLNVVDPLNADLLYNVQVPVVPPGAAAEFHPAPATAQVMPGDVDRLRVVVAFTDSAEVRWIRDQRGHLLETRESLTVFADIYRSQSLAPLLEQFGRGHGVDVDIQTVPWGNLQTEFLAAAASGRSPDIVVGAHDWLGNLVRHDVISPVDLGDVTGLFSEVAIDAMTVAGRLYGVPYAVEGLALLRNTEFVPDPPATIEALIEAGSQLVNDGRCTEILALPIGPTGSAFHIYPLFSAGGGYLFGHKADGSVNPMDLGLAHPAAVDSFRRIRRLAAQGVIRASMRSRQATALFKAGQAPFLITGPWAIGDLRAAGVPFEVSPLPGYADAPGQPQTFVGVQGFFLASGGRNHDVARELLRLLAGMDAGARLYTADPRPPALRALRAHIARDPATQAFIASAETGQLMAALPGMQRVWRAFERAEVAVLTGEPVAAAVTTAAREITEAIQRGGRSRG